MSEYNKGNKHRSGDMQHPRVPNLQVKNYKTYEGTKFVKRANTYIKYKCFNTVNKEDVFEWYSLL
jgi:hypothetical protein